MRSISSTVTVSAVLLEPAGLKVLIKGLGGPVVGRHVVPLPALLVEPQPPPAPLLEVVLSITLTSALSRSQARDPESMWSRSLLASAGVRTGVAPLVTTCFGPRTAAAGFTRRTWLTTSQSQSTRMAAKCCLTVGTDPGWVRM